MDKHLLLKTIVSSVGNIVKFLLPQRVFWLSTVIKQTVKEYVSCSQNKYRDRAKERREKYGQPEAQKIKLPSKRRGAGPAM